MKVELPLRHAATYSPYPHFETHLGCPSSSSSSSFFPPTSLASLLALASVAQNELLQRPRDSSVPFLVLPELKPCNAAPPSPQPQSPSPVSSPSHQSSQSSSSSSRSPSPSSPTLTPTHQQPDVSLLLSLAGAVSTPVSPAPLADLLNPIQQPASTTGKVSSKERKSLQSAFTHLPHKRAYKKAPLPASGKRCSSCGTNVTPEWRSGPQGPKTLCNACGLQYAKSQKLPRTLKSA